MITTRRALALLLLAPLPLVACNRDQPDPPMEEAAVPAPVAVAGLDLGRGATAMGGVSVAAESFGVNDTIAVSVRTTGAGTADLAATWTYQDGQVVNQESRIITPTGPATTAFMIMKADAWPTGTYTVRVTLDGAAAGERSFEVR